MIGGVSHRVFDVLAGPLLDPQQAGDAPMLRGAGALAGVLKTEQFGQMVFCRRAIQALSADLQLTALLVQEAFGQAIWRAFDVELQLDRGRCRRVAPGPQVIDADGAVPLEESRAHGGDDGALARFVGAGKQVNADVEVRDLDGLAKLFELFKPNACELHNTAPVPVVTRRSSRMLANSASESRATSAASATGPVCAARNSATTSPR